MELIENDVISYINTKIKEPTYLPVDYPTMGYPYEYEEGENEYRVFYFSNFVNPDTSIATEYELEEIDTDFLVNGNENSKSEELNDFFSYYFKFYDIYLHNNLPKELFDRAIADGSVAR